MTPSLVGTEPARLTFSAQTGVTTELVDRLTQKVRIKQEKGDAIFYEEKILKPDKKNITIDAKQVYIPVWQIRGKNRETIFRYHP